MGFEHQTIFNRKLLPVITVRNITLVLGVAASEMAKRERLNIVNIVSGLELNQQRWPLCFCSRRLSVAGTVEVRWITSICFESIGFGLRGLTQLKACVLPTVVLHLKFVSRKPQKKALTSQTGSVKSLLPTHLQRLVFCLISHWFARHIVVKPPHGERPFLSILSQCWNSVPRREWGFSIRRWRQHGFYLLAVCPYFLQNNV